MNSIGKDETPAIKYDRALALFTESVMKPDHGLRVVLIIKDVMMNLWKLENTF